MEAGQVAEFDQDTADLVNRDSEGTLEPLTAEEVAELEKAVAQASKRAGVAITPDWSPGGPAQPPVATGGGPVMGSGSHPGLIRADGRQRGASLPTPR
jgi:hypothetical protein